MPVFCYVKICNGSWTWIWAWLSKGMVIDSLLCCCMLTGSNETAGSMYEAISPVAATSGGASYQTVSLDGLAHMAGGANKMSLHAGEVACYFTSINYPFCSTMSPI